MLHTLQTFLLVVPVLLFSVIAHEIAHGYAALKQGDRTALEAGRLSWNPARHIDLYMTILLPMMMFVGSSVAGGRGVILGGAKPVPVDPRNYTNARRGDIIVSLAGVATNLLIAVLCAILIPLCGVVGRAVSVFEVTLSILQAMCMVGIWLNATLIAFNLLPIPPLDGSHVFKYLLPAPLAIPYVRFSRYGLVALLLLLFFGDRILAWWLTPSLAVYQFAVGALAKFILPSAAQWLM